MRVCWEERYGWDDIYGRKKKRYYNSNDWDIGDRGKGSKNGEKKFRGKINL